MKKCKINNWWGKPKRSERGFTAIELMGVILIGAIIIAGVIKLINAGKSTSNVASAHEEITEIASAGQALYLYSRGDYTGINAAVIANSTSIPEGLKTPKPPTKATGLINIFNQNVTVANSGKTLFVITYPFGTGEESACADTATKLIGQVQKVAAGVGGKVAITNAATAQTACYALPTLKVTIK